MIAESKGWSQKFLSQSLHIAARFCEQGFVRQARYLWWQRWHCDGPGERVSGAVQIQQGVEDRARSNPGIFTQPLAPGLESTSPLLCDLCYMQCSPQPCRPPSRSPGDHTAHGAHSSWSGTWYRHHVRCRLSGCCWIGSQVAGKGHTLCWGSTMCSMDPRSRSPYTGSSME